MLGSSDGGSSRSVPGGGGRDAVRRASRRGFALVDRPAMEVNVPLRMEELLFVLEL